MGVKGVGVERGERGFYELGTWRMLYGFVWERTIMGVRGWRLQVTFYCSDDVTTVIRDDPWG